MVEKDDKKELSDFIFDDLEGQSDGWHTRYDYGQVIKAMNYAYNLGIQNAAMSSKITVIANGKVVGRFDNFSYIAQDGVMRVVMIDKESMLNLKI